MFKLILLAFSLISFANFELANSQLIGANKCGVEKAKQFLASSIVPTVMGTKEDPVFPTSLAIADRYCENAKVAVKDVRAYSKKCLDGLPRQAISLVAYGMNKQIRNVCKNPAEIAKSLGCAAGNARELNEVFHKLTSGFKKVLDLETNRKIPYVCCVFHDVNAKLSTANRKVCNEQQNVYFNEFVKKFSEDVLDLLCSTTPAGSETCMKVDKELAVIEEPVLDENANYLMTLIAVLEKL